MGKESVVANTCTWLNRAGCWGAQCPGRFIVIVVVVSGHNKAVQQSAVGGIGKELQVLN